MKADDLPCIALAFLEDTLQHTGFQGLEVHGLEVLFGRQIQDEGIVPLIEMLGNPAAPEVIQVRAAIRSQTGAHFEPVRPHEVQRPQYPIKAAEHDYMILCPFQRFIRQLGGTEALVNVAIESEDRLA